MNNEPKIFQVRYLITEECISCGACWREVPQHFACHEIEANAIVCLQPTSDKDDNMCLKALQICPVNAIIRHSGADDSSIARDS